MLSHSQKRKGFTVGEVVLSSFVLTMGILSVMGLLTFSYRTSIENQNLIVASELAQEGVELARNVRDNALVDKIATGSPADVFTDFPTGGPFNRCIMDYADTVPDCAGSPDPVLVYSGNFYHHSAGAASGRFYRLLKVNHTGGADTARVKSFVAWQNPGNNLNGPGDTSWCTLANKCVYTEIFLTQWK